MEAPDRDQREHNIWSEWRFQGSRREIQTVQNYMPPCSFTSDGDFKYSYIWIVFGQVTRHSESWDVSALEAIAQIFISAPEPLEGSWGWSTTHAWSEFRNTVVCSVRDEQLSKAVCQSSVFQKSISNVEFVFSVHVLTGESKGCTGRELTSNTAPFDVSIYLNRVGAKCFKNIRLSLFG